MVSACFYHIKRERVLSQQEAVGCDTGVRLGPDLQCQTSAGRLEAPLKSPPTALIRSQHLKAAHGERQWPKKQ